MTVTSTCTAAQHAEAEVMVCGQQILEPPDAMLATTVKISQLAR
jgi:hypothetical protein